MRYGLPSIMASIILAGLLGGCGQSAQAPPAAPVHVAYAGSLELLNNQVIGPAFHRDTGIPYQGQGGGSFGIAHEIAAGSIPANVFESIGYAPIKILEPRQTSWALEIAASPLVIAFSPHSRYAAQLNLIRQGRKPVQDVFQIMAQPGFKLGRTNPNTDPQGQAFVMMVELAQKQYHLPARTVSRILGPLTSGPEIYTEEGVLSLLQTGGLDASSAFLSEAQERHLDYIPLPASLNFASPAEAGVYQSAHLTLSSGSVVTGTPLTVDVTAVGRQGEKNAVAFINFLISPKGQAAFQKAGYQVFAPKVLGAAKNMPSPLQHALAHA